MKLTIPILGFINAGKSTVIGALLQDEYSPTSASKCTSKIYRIAVHCGIGSDETDYLLPGQTVESHRNQQIDEASGLSVVTTTVLVRTPLPTTVHKELQLELIDLPGFDPDEALEKEPAALYAKSLWSTFACVILIIDIRHTTAKKQKELFCFIKNLNEDKGIPIIVLGNKVDSPSEKGMPENIARAQQTMKEVFVNEDLPAFIPISARDALFPRIVHDRNFQSFHASYGNRLEEIGARFLQCEWADTPTDKKAAVLFARLQNDATNMLEGSDLTCFGEVLKYLDVLLGEGCIKTVERLTRNQLNGIRATHPNWQADIFSISERLHQSGFGNCQKQVADRFWENWDEGRIEGLGLFKQKPDFTRLAEALQLVVQARNRPTIGQYFFSDDSSAERRKQREKHTVLGFFSIICNNFNKFLDRNQNKVSSTRNKKRRKVKSGVSSQKIKTKLTITDDELAIEDASTTWENLSAYDWKTILTAITDVPGMENSFPRVKAFLRYHLERFGVDWGNSEDMRVAIAGRFNPEDFSFLPDDPSLFRGYSKLGMPSSVLSSDPQHWGYVAFHYIWKSSNNV